MCFDSAWKTFQTRFKPILESLKRHRTLLRDQRLDAAVLEIQNSRDQTLRLLTTSADEATIQINHLKQHVEGVYHKLSSQIYDLHESSKTDRAHHRQKIPRKELEFIVAKLDPPAYEADQVSAFKQCHNESGNWIFDHTSFLKWTKSESGPDSVLFIHGMPGSGI